MATKIQNTNLLNAIKRNEDTPTTISFKAGSSPAVLRKIMSGQSDLFLTKIEAIADYLGFDVEVRFVKKPKVAA